MHPRPAVAAAHPSSSVAAHAGIALRNLFRHRRRTIINVIGIAVTVGALLFFQAFYRGSYEELMFGTVVDCQTAHIQVQAPGFEDADPDSYSSEASMIGDWAELDGRLQRVPGVRATAARLVVPAFAGDGIRTRAMLLVGIDPGREGGVMRTLDRITKGRYLSGPGEVLVGESLARMFGLTPGDQLKVRVRTVDDAPNLLLLKIAGVFSTGYPQIDRGMAFAALPDVQDVACAGDRINRIHIRVVSLDAVGETCTALRAELAAGNAHDGAAGLEAVPWTVPAAGMIEHSRGDRLFMYVFMAILLVLAVSTVAGTMFMAVFERTREIGTLRATGWHRTEIFRLFVIEAALIGAAGTALGLGLGSAAGLLLRWFPIGIGGASGAIDVPFLKVTSRLVGTDAAVAAAAGIISSAVAGIAPARRASRLRIVNALAAR
jgi:putative ABC transport system permease protein